MMLKEFKETATPLMAISPLDGRYATHCSELMTLTSEYGLHYYRLIVEIRWLQALAQNKNITEVPPLSDSANSFLEALIENYHLHDAQEIKTIEATTQHDVKAVEYFIKAKLAAHPELNAIKEFVHFACTSEDINNLAYALMMKDLRAQILVPQLNTLMSQLEKMAKAHASTPMLSLTHGQPASPTTVGKEIANVLMRLQRQVTQLHQIAILGKINGAVGNFNAHHIAYPEVAWETVSQTFVEALGLVWSPLTTQIEPHDGMSEYFHCLMRISTILIDFARDVWGYIALNLFKQKSVATEIGSSTMPHKINPIDFENAEGNLGLARALFSHFAEKLPISRWQRDLSDSTVLRNIGVACGYMLIALKALTKGLHKLEINVPALEASLDDNWEVLGEALQTVMRRYQLPHPYETLKELTRGKKINQASLHAFIDTLSLPEEVKQQLKALTPAHYTGLAEKLTHSVLSHA